jgi:hypothetical protein
MLRKAIAELESQEPVAWMDADGNVSDNNDHKCFPIPLYTHPPQPEQEPVALPCCGYADSSAIKWNSYNQVVQCHNCGQVYTHPSQRTEQEPVAWRMPNWSNLHGKYGYRDFDDPVCDIDGKPSSKNEPLYTYPPKRTWVGLTDVEIDYLLGSTAGENEETHISFARAVENELKERNT